MKTLFLYRHAKTHKADSASEDLLRALTDGGLASAADVGREIKADGLLPELILCSDALRARQTAEKTLEVLGVPIPIEISDAIYTAGVEEIFRLLSGRPEDRIMIVGHNPCIEETVETLLGDFHRMRPAYCMCIRFSIARWEELFEHPEPKSHRIYKAVDESE